MDQKPNEQKTIPVEQSKLNARFVELKKDTIDENAQKLNSLLADVYTTFEFGNVPGHFDKCLFDDKYGENDSKVLGNKKNYLHFWMASREDCVTIEARIIDGKFKDAPFFFVEISSIPNQNSLEAKVTGLGLKKADIYQFVSEVVNKYVARTESQEENPLNEFNLTLDTLRAIPTALAEYVQKKTQKLQEISAKLDSIFPKYESGE